MRFTQNKTRDMDTVYGSKKYFQSLGTSDNDYYNRHSSGNRVMQAACSSYQNTIGRHSTIGPYSHLTGNPYQATNGCNDFSYTNQYGYNSWGMWRDSRNLTPSSTYSSKSRSSLKSFTIILMTAAFIVILAVLSVAALAFYFSTFKSDDSIMIFDGRFQVTRGDVFTTGLKYNHTSVYQQKVEYYRNLITESLEHNGLTVYKCDIHGFGTGPLIQVDFRVFLDMRKVPMTIRSVEEHIKESLLKEIMSTKSNKAIAIDLPSLEIKRSLDEDVLKSASFVREMVTTPPSIVFDDKIARKGPSSTLISKPPLKMTTSKPKPKQDIIEPDIDIESVPVLQGSFEVTKTDADITEKKGRTSTLKPFTITNGSVRMKPKKTTIEKVGPLPKIPENLTANILKLENVTKAYQLDRVTTPKPLTTTRRVPISTTAQTERTTTSTKPQTTKIIPSSSFEFIPIKKEIIESLTVSTTTSSNIQSSVLMSSESPPKASVQLTNIEGEIYSPAEITTNGTVKVFPSTIVLDDQPWLPIQPNVKMSNSSPVIDLRPTDKSSADLLDVVPDYNPDPVGYQVLGRNKPSSISSIQKVSSPIYQSYNNPALMYGPHQIERLGNSHGVQPYPIPIDLIGDQFTTVKKGEGLVLNKGEVFPSDQNLQLKYSEGTTIITTSIPPMEIHSTSAINKEEEIELNLEETTDINLKNKSALNTDEPFTGQKVGEILRDLLKESNVKLNASSSDDSLESRDDELDLPEQEAIDSKNVTENTDEMDHTEALDQIATVLSSMETLSFKNIKDYIMATTKSFVVPTSTERHETTARREKPQNQIKSDRISFVASSLPSVSENSKIELTMSTTTPVSVAVDDIDSEAATSSYVEVETMEYTPWNAALFPVHTKWEYVNGSLVQSSPSPMRKVFNETLQAWIHENPTESTEHLPPINLIKNHTEQLKNISAIFDGLSSKLGIHPKNSQKLPPAMSHFALKKETHATKEQSTPGNLLMSTPAMKRTIYTTTSPPAISSDPPESDEKLPILLNQNTESYYGSSSEALGQAEVEEVDPTQYEQMLLIDRVATALHGSSTVPSLVTLLPVKSNSGIRHSFVNEKTKNSARGIPLPQTQQNRRKFEETSFVVRTNINIGS